MTGAMEQIAEVFRANQWNFDFDDEGALLRAGIDGQNGHWQVFITDIDDGAKMLMVSAFPQKALPNRRQACAELLTRINFRLSHGCFEMDYESGQIYFKTILPFAKGAADAKELKTAILHNIACMDRFLPMGMSVIYAHIAPARALAAAQRRQERAVNARKSTGGSRRLLGQGRNGRFMNN